MRLECSYDRLVKLKKFALIFIITGCGYTNIELLFRGYTHPSMIVVGGLCGGLIGFLSEKRLNLKLWQKCAISAILVLFIEFISGYILNIKFHLNVWDYSNEPMNILGQICPAFGIAWFFLSVVALWLNDYIGYVFFKEDYEGNLFVYIKRLITLK